MTPPTPQRLGWGVSETSPSCCGSEIGDDGLMAGIARHRPIMHFTLASFSLLRILPWSRKNPGSAPLEKHPSAGPTGKGGPWVVLRTVEEW
jgi:hypothetical protein